MQTLLGQRAFARHIPADARLECDRIVPELNRLGVLTSVDAATVEAHCLRIA